MPTLNITIVQSSLFWEDAVANRKMFEEKINRLQQPTQLVVLPEMFTTGFSMQPKKYAEPMDGTTVQWMQALALKYRIIICGSIMIAENENFYNRFLWVQPNGEISYYNKRHLFAYANEHLHYTAGNSKTIVSVNGIKICLQICYDLRFPVWARQAKLNDEYAYDVLLYVANWPIKRSNAWKVLLQARAIENQSIVIGVNRVGEDGNGHKYSGDSMVVDALGQVLYKKEKDEDIHQFIIDKSDIEAVRNQLPFLNDADNFLLINE